MKPSLRFRLAFSTLDAASEANVLVLTVYTSISPSPSVSAMAMPRIYRDDPVPDVASVNARSAVTVAVNIPIPSLRKMR